MKSAWFVAASACLVAACGPRSEFDTNALFNIYGLQSTAIGTQDAEAAIRLANTLLPKEAARLEGAWNAKGAAPSAAVFVYLGADRNLTPADLAFVTPACEAIVLHNPPFQAWLASLSDADGPSVDPVAMTAFVLLHEMGHLRRHDCGRQVVSQTATALNDESNSDKSEEFSADSVAITVLSAATRSGSVDAKVAAGRVEIALATASFYIAGRRIVAAPGADLLGSPSVFWDMGLSHPNFEWRLLKVNEVLNSNETSRKLLADFEAGRASASQPLYIAPEHR